MGGLGSGGRGNPYTLDDCLVIDFPLLMRRGAIRHGQIGAGEISWSDGREQLGSIGYTYDLSDPRNAELRISALVKLPGEPSQKLEQRVPLTLTSLPNGGVRWWLSCPHTGRRATKLYMPPGSTMFASRHAWGLGYQSQREARHMRPFERLHRIQRRLRQRPWAEMPIYRPKGMWRRTFERHADEGRALSHYCMAELDRLDRIISATRR